MAVADSTGPIHAKSPDLVEQIAEKHARALALLEEAWDLLHDLLDDSAWAAKVPAAFPDMAMEPLREAICFMRPAENYPAGTTRAEMEACAEAEVAGRH